MRCSLFPFHVRPVNLICLCKNGAVCGPYFDVGKSSQASQCCCLAWYFTEWTSNYGFRVQNMGNMSKMTLQSLPPKGIHTMVRSKPELMLANLPWSSPFQTWDTNSLWRCWEASCENITGFYFCEGAEKLLVRTSQDFTFQSSLGILSLFALTWGWCHRMWTILF